jgi:hypothetical protein
MSQLPLSYTPKACITAVNPKGLTQPFYSIGWELDGERYYWVDLPSTAANSIFELLEFVPAPTIAQAGFACVIVQRSDKTGYKVIYRWNEAMREWRLLEGRTLP